MEFKKPLSGIAGNTSSFEHFLQAPEGSFFFFAVHCAVTDCISVSLWAGIFSFTKVLFPLSVSLLSLLQNIFQKILQASGAHSRIRASGVGQPDSLIGSVIIAAGRDIREFCVILLGKRQDLRPEFRRIAGIETLQALQTISDQTLHTLLQLFPDDHLAAVPVRGMRQDRDPAACKDSFDRLPGCQIAAPKLTLIDIIADRFIFGPGVSFSGKSNPYSSLRKSRRACTFSSL